MRRSPARTARTVAAIVVALAAGSCASGQRVDVPRAGEITEPTFHRVPDDLADSFQLDAIVERNTAGLEPASPSVDAAMLGEALEALGQIDHPPTALLRLTIYADEVLFTFYENGVTGRAVSGYYSDSDRDLTLSEPSFSDEESYPIAAINENVPQRLVDAVETRFARTRVVRMDLDVGSSYEFGLAWYIAVEDAQGRFATIFADPDGAIVAVDQS